MEIVQHNQLNSGYKGVWEQREVHSSEWALEEALAEIS